MVDLGAGLTMQDRKMGKMMVGITLMVALCGSALAETPTSYGWIEKGLILPTGVAVKMKLDTGALTSSLDARSITRFKRDGKPWVRFMLVVTDADSGKLVKQQFERRVERSVTVRGAGGMVIGRTGLKIWRKSGTKNHDRLAAFSGCYCLKF